MTAQNMPTPLPFEALERVYDQLAAAIDRAGEANEALFLTKLVMVMAHRAGDVLDLPAWRWRWAIRPSTFRPIRQPADLFRRVA